MKYLSNILLIVFIVFISSILIFFGKYFYDNSHNKLSNIENDELTDLNENDNINAKYISDKYGEKYIIFKEDGTYEFKNKNIKNGTYELINDLIILDDKTIINYSKERLVFVNDDNKIYFNANNILEDIDKFNEQVSKNAIKRQQENHLASILYVGISNIYNCKSSSESTNTFSCDVKWYVVTKDYTIDKCLYDYSVHNYAQDGGWCGQDQVYNIESMTFSFENDVITKL
ncbi:MAG: hypothetical protein IJ574_01110 [Bacilli bacterium]|nr:hypothetical protein [Bacilli bacterium]